MKILKNAGFSLIEIMVGVGIMGIATLGVTHLLTNSNNDSVKFSNKIEIKGLMNLISLEYSKPDICSGQFGNISINTPSVSVLKSGNRVLLNVGMQVVNDRYRVDKIQTLPLDQTRFNLKITFKDLKARAGARDSIVEILPISADIAPDGIIKSCYNQGDTDSDPLDANLSACQGSGVIPHADGSCLIKNFKDRAPYKACAPGEAFIVLTNNNDTAEYSMPCVPPIEKTKNCQHDLIKQYSPEGNIECIPSLDSHVELVPVTIADGDSCRLIAIQAQGKIRFTCGGGSTPPPSGGCFVAGTQVHLLNGEMKNIEDIKVGDQLLDGDLQVTTVLTLLPLDYQGPIYSINGGGYFFTPNHPFKTLSGWKSLDPETSRLEIPNLRVSKMNVGDVLIQKDGLEFIHALDSIETSEKVYNFALSGSHEYIANDYVVHNKYAPCTQNPVSTTCPDGSYPDYCGVASDTSTGNSCNWYSCGSCD